ncbi:MAG: cysteine hydrolase family protein [bacterium]
MTRVKAEPYDWPSQGELDLAHTALICVDWQTDFCGKGGYVDRMGYDITLTRGGIEPARKVLDAWRGVKGTVIHTREGHRPDLSDLPPTKLWRSRLFGAGIGDLGPCGRILVRGEPGWSIIPELAPLDSEILIDKPGKGAFFATDLQAVLRSRDITHLIFTGITTDCCVQNTMRQAHDRGVECLLLSDCTGAADQGNYVAVIETLKTPIVSFGAVCHSRALLGALKELARRA